MVGNLSSLHRCLHIGGFDLICVNLERRLGLYCVVTRYLKWSFGIGRLDGYSSWSGEF